MIVTWPTTLPRPERDTYQGTYMEARKKTQAEKGPPSYPLNFSAVPQLVSMSLLVSSGKRSVFWSFYRQTSRFGSIRFHMPDPTRDGWPAADANGDPLLMANGTPILQAARWLCQFGDTPPAETLVGINFRIAFSVVVFL